VAEVVRICLEQFLFLAMTQEALPALSNQNDEEAARDEKGPGIFILSLAQDTRHELWGADLSMGRCVPIELRCG
jgi:hypothetical protein